MNTETKKRVFLSTYMLQFVYFFFNYLLCMVQSVGRIHRYPSHPRARVSRYTFRYDTTTVYDSDVDRAPSDDKKKRKKKRICADRTDRTQFEQAPRPLFKLNIYCCKMPRSYVMSTLFFFLFRLYCMFFSSFVTNYYFSLFGCFSIMLLKIPQAPIYIRFLFKVSWPSRCDC